MIQVTRKTYCAKKSPFEAFASMGPQWLAWPCNADRHSGQSFDEEASPSPSKFARCRSIYPATKRIEHISSSILLLLLV